MLDAKLDAKANTKIIVILQHLIKLKLCIVILFDVHWLFFLYCLILSEVLASFYYMFCWFFIYIFSCFFSICIYFLSKKYQHKSSGRYFGLSNNIYKIWLVELILRRILKKLSKKTIVILQHFIIIIIKTFQFKYYSLLPKLNSFLCFLSYMSVFPPPSSRAIVILQHLIRITELDAEVNGKTKRKY